MQKQDLECISITFDQYKKNLYFFTVIKTTLYEDNLVESLTKSEYHISKISFTRIYIFKVWEQVEQTFCQSRSM